MNESPWHVTWNHFRNALAVARLSCSEFSEAVEVLADEHSPMSDVLRIHAFGGLRALEKTRAAWERVRTNTLPPLVVLRDELVARYILPDRSAAFRPDKWVFDRECELVLVA